MTRASLPHLVSELGGRDDGVSLVVVALFLPVLVVLATMVIDIGNWFEHKRHLQMQADAAALAAIGDFKIGAACSNSDIFRRAEQYGGRLSPAEGYNQQVGGTPLDRVHLLMNSQTWPEQPMGEVDPDVDTHPPCTSGMVDVKMTETDLPWFFEVANLFGSSGDNTVDFINAHARVELKKLAGVSGMLPIGIPDPTPKTAALQFIDEDDPGRAVLLSLPLKRSSPTSPTWLTEGEGDLTVGTRTKIGVRVALSGGTSTTCGDPLVSCYDLADPKDGVLLIRGVPGGTAGSTQPRIRQFRLTPGSGDCSAYFSQAGGSCTWDVFADVDFGDADPSRIEVSVVVDGKTTKLTRSTDPATPNRWSAGGLTFNKQLVGPVPIDLKWKTAAAEGTVATIQRPFRADSSRSGPIRQALVTVKDQAGNDVGQVVPRCGTEVPACTYRVSGGISLARLDGEIVLKFGAGGGAGSLAQGLDCDPAVANAEEELTNGCGPTYVINTTGNCPATPTQLWAQANPPAQWDCVATEQGNFSGQVEHAFNARILGDRNPSGTTGCPHPNEWPSFDITGDPRYVHLFMTPYHAFDGAGQAVVPVKNFAGFYVTGWSGSTQHCPTDSPASKGTVVGHFVTYVAPSGGGIPGEEPCDLTDPFSSCIATLTR